MRMIIQDVWVKNLDATSVSITKAASDPVSTCTFDIIDNTSTYQPVELQEVLVLDTKAVPNATDNLLNYPDLNPYNTSVWGYGYGGGGLAISQNTGGGVVFTLTNVPIGNYSILDQELGSITSQIVTPNVPYVFSLYIQGQSSPTHFSISVEIDWYDTNGNFVSSQSYTGPNPPSTSNTRYSIQSTAPSNVHLAFVNVLLTTSSNTNSGGFILKQPQFEAVWFSDQVYPTPWCGPGQTNCTRMDNIYPRYIRQYRKFAGYLTLFSADSYHGNVRTWHLTASGYAWLFSQVCANNTYTNTNDSTIITDLINTYFTSVGGGSHTGTFTTTNVSTGTFITNYVCNWDDFRTIMDNLCAQSGFYWTVDYYWNLIYQDQSAVDMSISLICDNSAVPNMSTTFPGYNFSYDGDFTQPGGSILVFGNSTNVSIVTDIADTAIEVNRLRWVQIPANFASYSYKGINFGAFFVRKVNDSNLLSIFDTNVRGMAESIQYNRLRKTYHITTNVELIPGQNIAITSATDNLSNDSLFIQQTTAHWLGVDETLTDVWEYQSDIGTIYHDATKILSRIFRNTTTNTTTPTIVSSITYNGAYQQTILEDGPVAYYTLGESSGTTATDVAGLAYNGTLHGGITLGVTGLLTTPVDTAMSFNGTTGYISLPTTFVPTGSGHAWSLECWCKLSALPSNTNYYTMVALGTNSPGEVAEIKVLGTVSSATWVCSGYANDITGGTVATNTVYHVVGTYDGTNMRLYVNGSLIAGPTSHALNIVATFSYISATGGPAQFFNGVQNECAVYNYCLSASQISHHYTVGTT